MTSVFVTHDQEEALSISDRIAIMREGQIEQIGTPEDVYVRPVSRYVARFIGSPPLDFLAGCVEAGSTQAQFRIGAAVIPLPAELVSRLSAMPALELAARPEHVILGTTGVPATVRLVQPVGPSTFVTVGWEGGTLIARAPGIVRLRPGDPIHFSIAPEQLLFFDAASGRRIG